MREKLTWIHFVAWAAGWRRVDRRIFARDPPLIALSRQIDQCLTPFSLNFPFPLNFQFFTNFFRPHEEFWSETSVKIVFFCLLISNFDAKLLLSTPEILTDTSMMLFMLLLGSLSFNLFFLLDFLNHFQGYLTRNIFFLWSLVRNRWIFLVEKLFCFRNWKLF